MEYPDRDLYYATLRQGVQAAIESDLPAAYPNLTGASIGKIHRLLAVISESVPFEPDWKRLKQGLEIGDDRTLKTYLHLLEEAGILRSVTRKGSGLDGLIKPGKIYLHNPNLMRALSWVRPPETGHVRETFFLSMVSPLHRVELAAQGDFLVDGRFTVEIGGKGKTRKQIAGIKESHLVLDDLEEGCGNRIPLWLFGFLY